jgi:hypothetical protein
LHGKFKEMAHEEKKYVAARILLALGLALDV